MRIYTRGGGFFFQQTLIKKFSINQKELPDGYNYEIYSDNGKIILKGLIDGTDKREGKYVSHEYVFYEISEGFKLTKVKKRERFTIEDVDKN